MTSLITPRSSHWQQSSGMGIDFGLIFFSSNEASGSLHAGSAGDRYRLVIESARYADQHGFSSIWIPERHFTKDGWLYPNPAVLQAALARETSRIHLRAGSVVVPLHNPLRIAEEWAMVDNLSGGRVGVSFASGWHPNDFSLAPENYVDRSEIMYRNIEIVRKLWRGEAVPFKGGDGKLVELRTYPPPLQSDIPIWLTAAGNPKTFAGAGRLGVNLLTHMYNQSVDELAEKIRIYRDARKENGYDPEAGKVSVMLHTYVGADMGTVRAQIQGPFSEYLKSASYLVNAIAYSRGQQVDLSTLSEQDLQDYLLFVTDRLISQQRVLFGTPETCAPLVAQLRAAGVDEIACQMDFGVDIDLVLSSMPHLNRLREEGNAHSVASAEVDLTSTEHEQMNGMNGTVGMEQARSALLAVPVADSYHRTGASPIPTDDGVASPVITDEGAIGDIQRRCREEVSLPVFYQRLSDRGIQLTGGFQSITRLWHGDGEALGRIQISDTLREEANSYQIHPTLLDSCFQVIIAALPDSLFQQDNILYLPAGIQSFQLHARPGSLVWSHARLDTTADPAGFGQGPAQSLRGDVRILDEHGELVAEAKGLQLLRSEIGIGREPALSRQPLTDAQNEINTWLYQLRWEAINLPVQTASAEPGHWLIFMDGQGVGQYLVQRLQEYGHSCSLIEPGQSFQIIDQHHYQVDPANPQEIKQAVETALAAVQTNSQEVKQAVGTALAAVRTLPLRGVVHLWSLNTTASAATSLTTLEADQIPGVQSALNLIQALIEKAVQTRLWLITQGAQPVVSIDTDLAVAQSPIWGLGKTCAMEHPELWGGLIDLDPHVSLGRSREDLSDTTSQLMTVLQSAWREDQIALRGTTTYVARMVRHTIQEQRPLHIAQDAAYLITGGLWGLGLEIACWLASQGARQLILLGRSKLPPEETWDQIQPESRQGRQIAGVRSIRQLGAQVYYASIDVTDSAQLAAFLHRYQQQEMPPIRGIIHAASVWQDPQGQSLVRPLANLNVADLMTVLRPKMLGGWLLATLFKEMPLDFFVSFSSGVSLFGSAAQGNYAAASEFLDVLAHYQRAQGQPAISIDWGAISEIGFGATPEGLRVHEYWEAHGIHRISPRQVLATLALLIPQDLTRVGVLRLDWQLLRQFYPQMTDLPLVSQIVGEQMEAGPISTAPTSVATHEGSYNGSNVLQILREADRQEHYAILITYVQEQIANVLHIPAHRLDIEQPLTALGLDSLMAIELKNSIELDLRIRIPIVTLLQGPSISQFVNQVLAELEKELVPVSAGPIETSNEIASISPDDAERLLAQFDQLTDAQVDSLLRHLVRKEE